MNCDTAKTQFVDLMYDELDEKHAHNLQVHITSCSGCREEFETLTSTRQLLSAIPQEDPGERIVFTAPPQRSFVAWWRDFQALLPRTAWARLSLGAATLALFVLVAGSIGNLRLEYNDRGFSVNMSLLPQQEAQISPDMIESILTQARQENAQYTNSLLANERERQQQEWNETFTNFALEVERTHDTQLNLIGNQLERYNEDTNQQFRELIRSVSLQRR